VIWVLIAAGVIGLLTQLAGQLRAPGCSGSTVRIHEIQGPTSRSSLVGQDVSVSGVIVADFRGSSRLSGFFLQEEDTDADRDAATSEGIFIEFPDPSMALPIGRIACVTGIVDEEHGRTQLEAVTEILVHDAVGKATPTMLSLPLSAQDELERYEGMSVIIPQRLIVSDTHRLGRYGELLLAAHRLWIPTSVAAPGDDARAVAKENALLCVRLDDGSSLRNPDPIPYPGAGLTAEQPIRCGDMIADLRGVMDYRWDDYRIHPLEAIRFEPEPRPHVSPDRSGRFRIVGFNTQNYFNGKGDGTGFPTARGAVNAQEFERQRAKAIATLATMAADVVGLMEIENDGYSAGSAIDDLVRGINEAMPNNVSYAFVAPQIDRLGSDAISVALIYREGTVRPIGPALFPTSFSALTRVPLAQVFEETATGERLTVIVNHFKARSPNGAFGGNRDQGDEQGCWNLRRAEAATDLLAWMEASGVGAMDPDVLLIGDYNAYVYEDPIRIFLEAGYRDLIGESVGRLGYTYVYDGESGYIDHALSSSSLRPQVAGVAVWHINADEPTVLDYNIEYKSAEQVEILYAPDPFRSSDHDPVIVDLNLGPLGT